MLWYRRNSSSEGAISAPITVSGRHFIRHKHSSHFDFSASLRALDRTLPTHEETSSLSICTGNLRFRNYDPRHHTHHPPQKVEHPSSSSWDSLHTPPGSLRTHSLYLETRHKRAPPLQTEIQEGCQTQCWLHFSVESEVETREMDCLSGWCVLKNCCVSHTFEKII